MAGHDNYVIFQLDGIKGPIADNFRMVLNGLNQLRYIACSSTLSISPETLDFGLLQAYQATANQTIKEKPFQITASKNCNSAYGLGALLRPVNSSSTVGDTLVPGDNKSVGITVLRQEDRSIVPFQRRVPTSGTQQRPGRGEELLGPTEMDDRHAYAGSIQCHRCDRYLLQVSGRPLRRRKRPVSTTQRRKKCWSRCTCQL